MVNIDVSYNRVHSGTGMCTITDDQLPPIVNYDPSPNMCYSKYGYQVPQLYIGKDDDKVIEVGIEKIEMDLKLELSLVCTQYHYVPKWNDND